MYSIIKTSHSHLAWVALVLLLIAVVISAASKFGNKPFTASSLKVALYGLIGAHVQLLLGVLLYLTSPHGLSNLSGATMKDPFGRLLAVEHPLINIIGIILITMGYVKAKKAMGTNKSSSMVLWYYGVALVLILSRIPWQNWL